MNDSSASNRQAVLRNGLTQYIGAMLDKSDYKLSATRQLIVAALLEEAVKICKRDDGTVDMYAAKPILRAMLYIYDHEYEKAVEAAKESGLGDSILPGLAARFEQMKKPIQSMIDAAKEK